MKLILKLYWEKPGEKQKFASLIEGKDFFEAIGIIANEFNLDFADAKQAIETFNTYIKK